MKGEETRAAIMTAAAKTFAEFGYESATLEQVAGQLNLTRSAVLFHFASKRALLFAVIDTLLEELDHLCTDFERLHTPLSPRNRRAFLGGYVEALARHHEAANLLARDIASVGRIRWPEGTAEATARVLHLLQGSEPDPLSHIRTLAAMGTIVRTMSFPRSQLAELDKEAQAQLVECALAALNAPPPRHARVPGTPNPKSEAQP